MADDDAPSRFSRLAALGGLTGRVAGKYVAERVRGLARRAEGAQAALDAVQLANAEDVARTMSRLKGAAMKVGQQVALFADNLDLPPEIGHVLGKLHAEAQPIPFHVIREDVEAALGRPLDDAFAQVDPTPLGTASLAQAHVARLYDGREVVIKVLHRGVDVSVDTDLAALKALMLSGRVLRRSKAELDRVFEEIRDRLLEELDYLQEAANVAAYRRIYGDDPRVRIPEVHAELSTERVLVMDRLPGKHVDAFLVDATPEARQRVGQTLAEIYYEQLFHHRMLHADPHPGNYLFEPDGRVGILDFGCVKRFDEFWIGSYAQIALALLDGDRDAGLKAAIDLGAWDGEGEAAADALWAFIDAMGGPFRDSPVTLGQGRENYLDDMKPAIRGVIPHPNVTAPKPLIMLHRSLGGIYALSRKLEPTIDYAGLVRPAAQHAVDRAAGRLPTG